VMNSVLCRLGLSQTAAGRECEHPKTRSFRGMEDVLGKGGGEQKITKWKKDMTELPGVPTSQSVLGSRRNAIH
jgi:hypothetical protein